MGFWKQLFSLEETYQDEDDTKQDSLNNLKQKMLMFTKAVDKPVLDFDNFVFAKWSNEESW